MADDEKSRQTTSTTDQPAKPSNPPADKRPSIEIRSGNETLDTKRGD